MELEMKRFTTAAAVFSVSILAVWSIFQLYTVSQPRVNPSHNEQLKALNASHEVAIPAPNVDARKIAPVFDSNGSVVSDPSGTILNSGSSGAPAIPVTGVEKNVAPVIDSSGVVVSNPSGMQLNAPNSKSQGNIAPVFDSNGTVVSDPSGTILNSSHP